MNSFSISTASTTILRTVSSGSLLSRSSYRRQAKSQCKPSSREMSSLEKVNPGINPLFLSQKMAQKDPEKKIPSTHAKASKRVAKFVLLSIHLSAQSAFFFTAGTVSMALNRWVFSSGSLMYVSSRREYISEWMFSMAI